MPLQTTLHVGQSFLRWRDHPGNPADRILLGLPRANRFWWRFFQPTWARGFYISFRLHRLKMTNFRGFTWGLDEAHHHTGLWAMEMFDCLPNVIGVYVCVFVWSLSLGAVATTWAIWRRRKGRMVCFGVWWPANTNLFPSSRWRERALKHSCIFWWSAFWKVTIIL